ncbi:MAG: sodium:proton antiporter [Ruminococcus sp.]|nr:sodium:proton antiporter [Ruminococcus sp.]
MGGFLTNTVIILAFVVLLGYLNEKVTKFTYEISLLLFSVLTGGVLLFFGMLFGEASSVKKVLEQVQVFHLESFLMEGVLCFMLFAGSCHMRLQDFGKHARTISILAVGATFLGAVFYGGLFYAAGRLLGLDIPLPVCLLFGSITAPTDPIAATSILKKFHLPSGVGFIMEGESLLNDGVGVALFVCFSGLVTAQKSGGFFLIMAKELCGAVAVGAAVTAVCFPVFCTTADENRQIFTSLLAVSLAYVLCERFGFSGAIASVVCGVLFSTLREREAKKGRPLTLEQFDHFWGILDTLLNSALYVMLGLSFLHILQMPHVLLLSAVAIAANLLARSGSLGISTLFMGTLPDGYDRSSFVKLLTWGGLRGGLSAALAMQTQGMLETEVYYIVMGGTYAIIFFTTVIQGMTMQKVYQKIEKNLQGDR